MATRNIVPRADGEGNIGTALKNWLKGWFDSIYVSGNLTDGTDTATVANLKLAVDVKHTQNTDTTLPITVAPGSDHLATGIKVVLTSTGTFNFGDVGYIKSDGTVGFADATVIATASGLVMCADAQLASTSGNWLLLGIARDDSWAWTPGGLIYLTITGTTGNTLSQTAPTETDEVVQVIGVATHADRMYFKPELTQIELA